MTGLLDKILNHIAKGWYPVGSIYMSVNSTNPATLFGGQWERIQDKFLLACGSTYNNGATGGTASTSYTPKGTNSGTAINVSQMPSHQHRVVKWNKGKTTTHQHVGFYESDASSGSKWQVLSGADGAQLLDCGTEAVGGGKTHTHTFTGTSTTINTMPPYLAVYVWKRIA